MRKCKILVLIMLVVAISLLFGTQASAQHKREFRGAWIQAVNGQWQGVGRDAMQRTLTYQLNELQKDGVNAIIFQIRPECDALYASKYEPWSRFLTGAQGAAPNPYWDPLQWMIEQCHQRGMELHAWINPYRAKTKATNELSTTHVAIKHPEWVFPYDGLLILNPAIPECRNYICDVVIDIIQRYDVDGLHIDDYFYPYPVKGQAIPDAREFEVYNSGFRNIGDWRRNNVNLFIKQLHETIQKVKPWVKFGVSPFGIYRNRRVCEFGSQTNGLQNYDDLYADVLMWVNNGWIDYCVPQIYWEIGNKAADYKELIGWWNKYAGARPLFIGEDVERTVKHADPLHPSQHQLPAKMALHQQMPHVNGTVLWYAKAAVDNTGNYGTLLRTKYWNNVALQPLMPWIDRKAPKKVKQMKVIDTADGRVLFWTAPKAKSWKDEAVEFVVYRFDANERVDINNPSRIVCKTRQNFYLLPTSFGRCTYVVTALDRMHNESKGKRKKLKN